MAFLTWMAAKVWNKRRQGRNRVRWRSCHSRSICGRLTTDMTSLSRIWTCLYSGVLYRNTLMMKRLLLLQNDNSEKRRWTNGERNCLKKEQQLPSWKMESRDKMIHLKIGWLSQLDLARITEKAEFQNRWQAAAYLKSKVVLMTKRELKIYRQPFQARKRKHMETKFHTSGWKRYLHIGLILSSLSRPSARKRIEMTPTLSYLKKIRLLLTVRLHRRMPPKRKVFHKEARTLVLQLKLTLLKMDFWEFKETQEMLILR